MLANVLTGYVLVCVCLLGSSLNVRLSQKNLDHQEMWLPCQTIF